MHAFAKKKYWLTRDVAKKLELIQYDSMKYVVYGNAFQNTM